MITTRHLIRPCTALVLGSLVAASCGGSDAASDSTAAPAESTTAAVSPSEPADTSPPPTEPPATDAPPPTESPTTDAPAATDAPATTETSTTAASSADEDANSECPSPTPIPALETVEPDALPLPPEEELTPLDPGRYRSERLGVGLAIDVPDGFFVPTHDSGLIMWFGAGGRFGLARPMGYITSEPERGVPLDTVDVETWLASGLVSVDSETSLDVAGYPARDLVLSAAGASPDAVVPWTATWGIGQETVRMVVVDLGEQEPLVVMVESDAPGDPTFDAVADQMIASLAVGEVGPSLDALFAATPWDTGNLDLPVDVDSCTVPLVAFGETEFQLASPARVFGQGDEIWIVAPDEPWVGTGPPFIQLVGPSTATSLEDFSRRNGDPIETIDEAVAALEAAGYVLTPLEVDATLLGADITAFEFEGPEDLVAPWLARSNPTSVGDANISDPPFRVGVMYLAETEVGVVVARVDGENGTDDVELMRERFDTLVSTLAFR